MHHAPKIHWQVSRLRVQALVLVGLWLAGLMACGAWWLSGVQGGAVQAGVAVAMFASGAAAMRGWLTTLPGTLEWDGKGWAWMAEGQRTVHGDIAVSLDFQRLMLLRFAGASGGVWWLWVEPGGHAVQWRALRRALFADRANTAARTPAPGGEQPVDPASR